MGHSYVAYIDESGDDGLGNFRANGAGGGQSHWLVLSACLYRRAFDLDAVRWRDDMAALVPGQRRRDLHFAKMPHGQRLAASRSLASRPVRRLSVLSNKPTIPNGVYTQKNQLYFYLTRYLIERLSWLCRDLRPQVPEGDGRVRITFSRRGGMSYTDFRDYLQWLRMTDAPDMNIHWPVIDIDAIDAIDHSRNAGLQLADTIASAFAAGVEIDRYGNCEPRYAEILKRITYERRGNYFSYGVKLVPPHHNMELAAEQVRFIDIFK